MLRREQEHLVGDPLHATVQRVGQPAREVDQPLGQIGVGALEVEDHRDRVLELVGDVLHVVEVLGGDEVDADVPAAAAPVPAAAAPPPLDRAQRGGPPLGAGIVGEDVVDLVAPPPRAQPTDVGALAVAVLELDLGLAVGLELLVVGVVLGEAEVNECAVPGVAKGHVRVGVRRNGGISLPLIMTRWRRARLISERRGSCQAAQSSRPPVRRRR